MSGNRPTPPPFDPAALAWRKASASSDQGACVEVAPVAEGWVALRDSKNPEVAPFFFTPAEWSAFQDGVRGGEFDNLG
jgi:hypothetical protein